MENDAGRMLGCKPTADEGRLGTVGNNAEWSEEVGGEGAIVREDECEMMLWHACNV